MGSARTAAIERAAQVIMAELARTGTYNRINARDRRVVVKMLHLFGTNEGWRSNESWKSEGDWRAYAKAAGFDETGRIVDYERFYDSLEAWGIRL